MESWKKNDERPTSQQPTKQASKNEWMNARNKNNQRRIKDKTRVLKKAARKNLCMRGCVYVYTYNTWMNKAISYMVYGMCMYVCVYVNNI